MNLNLATLVVSLGLIAPAVGGTVELGPDEILKQVEIRSSPPQEMVELRMVIQEPSGSKKERWLSITRKNGKEQKALVRLEKPSDLKGLALLSVNSESKEDQWLYLPSTKKTRRILGSNSKGKFLDSEIAYEDLKASTYKSFVSKIVSKSPGIVEIEGVARKGTPTAYSKVKTWVSVPDYKIVRLEYWDDRGKLLKRTEFKGYERVGEKYWRAKFMEVQNVQNKRRTVLELKRVSLKDISDDDVSLSALEDN